MMYLISTDYEQFAFETEEELNEFLATVILPPWMVQSVPDSPMYERMALDTRWKLM